LKSGSGHERRHSEFDSETNLTLSAAGGARFDVNDRWSLLGEFRLRGVEAEFVGSTAEVIGGVSYRLGR
jgi:hypothetical protein